MKNPKITVITPSFNQVKYLEDTIISVIGQGYINLEYILLDGGSTDGSNEIIKKYKKYFKYYRSSPDGGQSSAINEGIKISTGDAIMWVNSDDYLLPNSLRTISETMNFDNPELLIGNCVHMWDRTAKIVGSNIADSNLKLDITYGDYIIQPSSVFNRKSLSKVGLLNEKYKFVFDWDLFIRLKSLDVKFTALNEYLSVYRIHDQHKSSYGGAERLNEIRSVYTSYHSENVLKCFDWAVTNKRLLNKIYKSFGILHLGNLQFTVIRKLMGPIASGINDLQIYQILNMSA